MILKNIELNNFRLCERGNISFKDNVNLIYGKNAEGKTNVLEAIYFFARGKSFRGGKDTDIVRFSEKGYSIKIVFEKKDGEHILEYRYYDGKRQRLLNEVNVSAKEFIGKFNAVFFCPDHLSIIKDAPSTRREFLNIAISQLSSEYVLLLYEHKKLTESKNVLLKSEEPLDFNLIASYNEKLAVTNAKIYKMRIDYIKKLSLFVNKTVNEISMGKENAEIFYKSDAEISCESLSDLENCYAKVLNENLKREIAAKMCLVGVHRDDLIFTINKKDARQFASQGQQRSLALALKLSEGEIIKEEKGEAPVYLFDDVLGELDEDRKSYVLSRTEGRQMIVTACEKGDYLKLDGLNLIFAKEGKYSQDE